jgi:hypothetical protein
VVCCAKETAHSDTIDPRYRVVFQPAKRPDVSTELTPFATWAISRHAAVAPRVGSALSSLRRRLGSPKFASGGHPVATTRQRVTVKSERGPATRIAPTSGPLVTEWRHDRLRQRRRP